MNCNKNPYAKSCTRVYNNAPQTLTTTATPLVIEGTPVVDSGCSLSVNPSSITICKSGLYHLSADVAITPTEAGTSVVQFYNNGVAMPCAIAQNTAVDAVTFTAHIETDICVTACCVSKPQITLVASGVTGTVTHTCVGALKLA